MVVPHPRRLYYGWFLVLTLAFTELVSYGVLYYAVGLFIAPMEAELGWTRAQITGAVSLGALISGLAGLPAGRLFDRSGPRWGMTIGSLLAAAMVLAWSWIDGLAGFYLLWAGIGVSMALVLYDPAFWIVAVWFRRHRSRAFTLLTVIAGFASVVFFPLTERLIAAFGWRGALVVLAILLAVITVPLHALVVRRRPSDLGLNPDGDSEAPAAADETAAIPLESSRAALGDPTFRWLTAAFFLNTLVFITLNVHLVPLLVGRGFETSFAASAAGLIGVMSIPGRLIFTLLGDVLPRRWVIVGIFGFMTAAVVVLAGAYTQAAVIGFVALYGAGFGAITPARAVLIAELYGAARYGRINSLLGFITTGARVAAPVAAGALYDSLGTYTPLLWGLAVISAFSALAGWKARR
ncbi:MAG: MFS transporter [Anaerolineae bacterium]|nr:MFS transporter [Anaerolineae bacterium]